MEQEIHMIHKNYTWQLVDLPPYRKPIIIKWVYKLKTHVDGIITKFKARLVARGFQQ
jgi:histone deacetylase 1/2